MAECQEGAQSGDQQNRRPAGVAVVVVARIVAATTTVVSGNLHDGSVSPPLPQHSMLPTGGCFPFSRTTSGARRCRQKPSCTRATRHANKNADPWVRARSRPRSRPAGSSRGMLRVDGRLRSRCLNTRHLRAASELTIYQLCVASLRLLLVPKTSRDQKHIGSF